MYKIHDEILDIIKNTNPNELNYFIRPYYNEYTGGLGQLGSSSDRFNLLGEQTAYDYCFETDSSPYLSRKEFDIVAEVPFDDDSIPVVVGHIYGYIINQEYLFEDMREDGHSFIEFDGISQIMCEFWHILNKIYKNSFYEECLRLIDEAQAHLYLVTNIDLINELYSPKVEDLIMRFLIPSFFGYNNISIYNVIKTVDWTEYEDEFTSIMDSRDELSFKRYLKEMIDELGYTLIKDDECKLELLSKKVQYGFFQGNEEL